MNEAGRTALRAAALAGVRQIRGHLRDATDGRCAYGALEEACDLEPVEAAVFYDLRSRARCPLCRPTQPPYAEGMLLLHLNDHHRCDFLKIASLMPVSEEHGE